MKTQIYPKKKTFSKFDEKHFIVYLNEEQADYVPSLSGMEQREGENVEPVPGYSYSGPLVDGGTMIEAKEACYAEFVSGLLRLSYSADAESAILANMTVALSEPKNERAAEFKTEWKAFQAKREECKQLAHRLLG